MEQETILPTIQLSALTKTHHNVLRHLRYECNRVGPTDDGRTDLYHSQFQCNSRHPAILNLFQVRSDY